MLEGISSSASCTDAGTRRREAICASHKRWFQFRTAQHKETVSNPLRGTDSMPTRTVLESNDIETVARVGDTLGYARVSTHDQNPDASATGSLRRAPFASSPTSSRVSASTGLPWPNSSITPDPVTASASFASTDSDAHSGNCSKPSTISRPGASTWSASRSVSTPRPRPANSCSTSSAPSRTSNAGSSPRAPATASPRPGNAGEH